MKKKALDCFLKWLADLEQENKAMSGSVNDATGMSKEERHLFHYGKSVGLGLAHDALNDELARDNKADARAIGIT